MAKTDAELVIRAKDEASKALVAIGSALEKLKAAQTAAGAGAGKAGAQFGTLTDQLAELQAHAQALSQFGKLAAYLDSATKAFRRIESATAKASEEQARIADQSSEAAAALQRLVAAQNAEMAALARHKAQAAADAKAQRDLTTEIAKTEGKLSKLQERFATAKIPGDKLRATIEEQKAALASLRGAQEQATAAANASKAALDAQKAKYQEVRGQVAEANKSHKALETTLDRATVLVGKNNAALESSGAHLDEIRTLAGQVSSALGGVAVAQDAIADASTRAAAAVQQVSAALSRQDGQNAAPATSGGPAAQATAQYRSQVAAVNNAREAYAAARVEATRLGRELAKTATPTTELKTAFLLARDASDQAKAAYVGQAEALNKLKGVARGSFADLAKIPAAVEHIESAMSGGGGAVRGGRELKFLGLTGYKLQNLSYQINDLVTQIGSGTPVTQAFAQQGGQILQLFPELLSGAIRFLPTIAAVTAAVATVGNAMKDVADQESTERSFTGRLSTSADGARYSAKALGEAAHALDVYGTSLKDAREELTQFVSAGVNPTKLEAFGRTAQNMADVLGIKVPDAASKMTDSLTKGYEGVKALDDAVGFLTLAEREQIRALFDAGKAAEARTLAYQLFERSMDQAAQKARGPWSSAIRDLSAAWSNFMSWIGNSQPIQTVIQWLEQLARTAKWASGLLPGAAASSTSTASGAVGATLGRLQNKRNQLAASDAFDRLRNLDAAKAGGRSVDAAEYAKTSAQVAGITASIRQLDAAIAMLNTTSRAVAGSDTTLGDSVRSRKIGADIVRTLKDQADSLKGVNDQRRIAIAGEKAYNDAIQKGADQASALEAKRLAENIERYSVTKELGAAAHSAESKANALAAKLRSAEETLRSMEDAMDKRAAAGQTLSLADRLAVITDETDKVRRELAAFQKLGGTSIGAESIDAFKSHLDTNEQLLKNLETIKFYEERLADLEKQRDEKLSSIADRYSDGSLSAAQAFTEQSKAAEEFRNLIVETAKAAQDFAVQIRGAKPDPALESFAAKMSRIASPATSGAKSIEGKVGASLLSSEEQRLNALLSERRSLVETLNQLYEAGAIGQDELRARTLSTFNDTRPEIDAQIASLTALVEKLHEQKDITDQAYSAWIAKIQLTKTNLDDLSATQFLTVKAADEMIANSFSNRWDEVVQKIQGGTNAFKALGDGIRSVAADVVLQIAKMMALNAAIQFIQATGLGKWLSNTTNGLVDTGGLMKGSSALAAAGLIVNNAATKLLSAATALAASGNGGSTGAGGSGGFFQAVASFFAKFFHEGGVVGQGGRTGPVLGVDWSNVPKFHSGGFPGLRSDEVRAVLKRGEEVLTENDPRHAANGGGMGGRGGDVKIVNVFDPADVLAHALGSTVGEKVLLNWISQNSGAFKAALR